MWKRARPQIICTIVFSAISLTTALSAHGQPVETCQLGPAPPEFLSESADDGLHAATLPDSTPHTGLHGQLMVGSTPGYLNHLPVFMGHPDAHPHNFQVILEVTFANPEDAALLRQDMADNPATIYTAVPPVFDQYALVAGETEADMLGELPGTAIVRGHFEQGGVPIIDAAMLEIARVVHFHEFLSEGTQLEGQHYVVYGRDGAAFMSHLISAPPDFDQTLAVALSAVDVPTENLEQTVAALLADGLYLQLPDRANDASARVRVGEVLECSLDTGTRALPITVEMTIDTEIYCEVGELSALVVDRFNTPQRCSD